MESFIGRRSISSTMSSPLMFGGVVIAFDVLKTRDIQEFSGIISEVLKREETFQEVRKITLLGALDKVPHPMGFQIQVEYKSFIGAHARAVKEEVSRKVDSYVSMLQGSAEECEEKGVEIEVKIAVGAPVMNVLMEEISSLHASWAILDRKLRRDYRCYLKRLSCKVAQIRDNLSVEIIRSYHVDNGNKKEKHRRVYSLSKPVPFLSAQDDDSDGNSLISLPITPMIRRSNNPNYSFLLSSATIPEEQVPSLEDESCTIPNQEISGCEEEQGNEQEDCPKLIRKDICLDNTCEGPNVENTEQDATGLSYSEMKIEPGEYSSDTSPEEGSCGLAKGENKIDCDEVNDKTQELPNGCDEMGRYEMGRCLDSLGCSYESIQAATDDFSFDNFIGEGGYGIVYKGKLHDGQLVAVKVQKETKAQSCEEFLSEVSPLTFVRHTNIVALLGYCLKGNLRILIYEYISNKSLQWHLFDSGAVLDWNQRCSIAVGAAKALRFLHEECRGSPIVHCNVRPSNVLLTHDLVPMLADSGLANSGTSKFDKQRKLMGNLGYVAPECKGEGVGCVKADVYAYGILLMQLISGRKAVDPTGDNEHEPIRPWALSLIQMHALQDLVDPRLGDAYGKYELYTMARAAYLCLQTEPLSRPTMKEVLDILEGTNDHFRYVKSNLYPMIMSIGASLD